MEWACSRYSLTPDGLRRTFSMALLLVYFDIFWWSTVAMPPEAEVSDEMPDPGDW
jgi:hypothetical protein